MSNQSLIEAESRMEEAKKVYDEACKNLDQIRQEIRKESMDKLEKARAQVRRLEKEAGIAPTSYEEKNARIYRCRSHPWVVSTSPAHECPNCECFCE